MIVAWMTHFDSIDLNHFELWRKCLETSAVFDHQLRTRKLCWLCQGRWACKLLHSLGLEVFTKLLTWRFQVVREKCRGEIDAEDYFNLGQWNSRVQRAYRHMEYKKQFYGWESSTRICALSVSVFMFMCPFVLWLGSLHMASHCV